MTDYVPTTEDVKEVFVAAAKVGLADAGTTRYNLLRGVAHAALWFDRWYAEEIRKAKEEAWDDGHFWGREYRAQALNGDIPTPNPYREEFK